MPSKPPMPFAALVQGLLTVVAERRVAEVVGQAGHLDDVGVAAERRPSSRPTWATSRECVSRLRTKSSCPAPRIWVFPGQGDAARPSARVSRGPVQVIAVGPLLRGSSATHRSIEVRIRHTPNSRTPGSPTAQPRWLARRARRGEPQGRAVRESHLRASPVDVVRSQRKSSPSDALGSHAGRLTDERVLVLPVQVPDTDGQHLGRNPRHVGHGVEVDEPSRTIHVEALVVPVPDDGPCPVRTHSRHERRGPTGATDSICCGAMSAPR